MGTGAEIAIIAGAVAASAGTAHAIESSAEAKRAAGQAKEGARQDNVRVKRDTETMAQKADLQAARDAQRINAQGQKKKKESATVLGGIDGSVAGTTQTLGGVPGKTMLGG